MEKEENQNNTIKESQEPEKETSELMKNLDDDFEENIIDIDRRRLQHKNYQNN